LGALGLTAVAGCSEASQAQPASNDAPDAGSADDSIRDVVWPDVPPDTCVEVFKWPSGSPLYFRRSWDAVSSILYEEVSSTPAFTGANHYAARFGGAREVMARIGWKEGDFQGFQWDYRYDDTGNAVESRLSYPARPDVMVPSTAMTSSATVLANEYDERQWLKASNETYFSGTAKPVEHRITFYHDANGRCDQVEGAYADDLSMIEKRIYDAQNRVVRVETTSNQPGRPVLDCGLVTLTTYDAAGRIRGVRRRPCEDTTDARAAIITTYKYRSDGVSEIEYLDFLSDQPNDTIVDEEGGVRLVTRMSRTRNAACAALDAAIASTRDNRCWVSVYTGIY
jgi:hypothetical protein